MVKNSTIINLTNNYPSPPLIEHKKDHDIWCWKSRSLLSTGRNKYVTGWNLSIMESHPLCFLLCEIPFFLPLHLLMPSLPTVLQVNVFSNQDMECQYHLCQGLCLRNSLDQILQLIKEIWTLIPEKWSMSDIMYILYRKMVVDWRSHYRRLVFNTEYMYRTVTFHV